MRDGVSGRLRPHAHLVFLWVIFVTLRAFPSTRTLSRRDAWLGARPLGRYEGLLNVPVKEDNPTEATDGPGGPFDERKTERFEEFKLVEVPWDVHEPLRELRCRQIRRKFQTRLGEKHDTYADELVPFLRARLKAEKINKSSEIVQLDSPEPLMPRNPRWDENILISSDDDGREPYYVNKSYTGSIGIGSIPLVHPKHQTNQTGVSVYYDDKCFSKSLPFNQRATDIVMAAGENTKIQGDAYLSRVKMFPKTNGHKRLDFTLRDCKSDATWVLQGRKAMADALDNEQEIEDPQQYPKQRLPPNVHFKPTDFRDMRRKDEEEQLSGSNDRYNWSQSLGYATILVPLPVGVTRKNVNVTFGAQWIAVRVRERIVLEGELNGPIYLDSALWLIEGNLLQVHLDKSKRYMWPWLVQPSPAMVDDLATDIEKAQLVVAD
ncbi:hypothetical protein AAMO2058_000969300 [Amorphochlora amoebiformis]